MLPPDLCPESVLSGPGQPDVRRQRNTAVAQKPRDGHRERKEDLIIPTEHETSPDPSTGKPGRVGVTTPAMANHGLTVVGLGTSAGGIDALSLPFF